MNLLSKIIIIFLLIFPINDFKAQTDSISTKNDSVNNNLLNDLNKKLSEMENQRIKDSVKKVELENKLKSLTTTDILKKEELLNQLKKIEESETLRISLKKSRIDSLRNTATGYPVKGLMDDTLFFIYSKIGASSPKERSVNIYKKINELYNDDFLRTDSIIIMKTENTYDIVYKEIIIMSISENDALWYNSEMKDLSLKFRDKIRKTIIKSKEENSLNIFLIRLGLVLAVIIVSWLIVWVVGKGKRKLTYLIVRNKDKWFKNLMYKDYTFLGVEQEVRTILIILNALRWVIFIVIFYIAIPIIFSIFPFSRNWASTLLHLIWVPFKNIFSSVYNYLPNLFSIIVIYIIMRYFIKLVRYIFSEIESNKLKISGFHADWSMPTFGIIKFLLYAFMFVLIFPYLPGSDSNIFKGVSVFIGILFSLGSSSAIANIVAGLVITYMRPFKIGDRITLGDKTGDVLEKTLLVTRIKTIKNEIVTIPNSSVLSGNTINYSTIANEEGLIIHTTVTIGYDILWQDVHKALIEAAERTELILKKPVPFVLQTALNDFYVAYQINAYIKEVNRQALIYSELHKNIQDVFNENQIEILSPHYEANRNGNPIAIPQQYQK